MQDKVSKAELLEIWQEHLREVAEPVKLPVRKKDIVLSDAERQAAYRACRAGRIRFERNGRFKLIEQKPQEMQERKPATFEVVSRQERKQGKISTIKRRKGIVIAHWQTEQERQAAEREKQIVQAFLRDLPVRLYYEREQERLAEYPLARADKGYWLAKELVEEMPWDRQGGNE